LILELHAGLGELGADAISGCKIAGLPRRQPRGDLLLDLSFV
jgi:hypothetical protein